jgi:hypothetical protein
LAKNPETSLVVRSFLENFSKELMLYGNNGEIYFMASHGIPAKQLRASP